MNNDVVKEKKCSKYTTHRHRDFDVSLLSDVVHKIKNSLGGIGGFAALLDRDLRPNDKRKKWVRRIQDGVIRVNDVVVNLMMLVREIEPCYERLQLQLLLKDVWKNYWGISEKGTLQILSHTNGKVELFADPYLVEQLIFHAIKFIDLTGGQIEAITINTRLKKNIRVEFSFLNTVLQESRFENLSRLVDECEPIEARLSLAIVLKVVRLHEGKVTIVTDLKKRKVLRILLRKGK